MQKEGKVKQAERLAAARQGLVAMEGDRHTMHMLRANLETCRWVGGWVGGRRVGLTLRRGDCHGE